MGFSRSVTLTLGQRSAYLCNNPDCRKLTVGPHSEAAKSLITGEAAHICAESEGGPRYDPTQSEMDRNAIANGIWFCTECHTKVDRDPVFYTREKLLNWKAQHEVYISGQGWKPDLPQISISTRRGLTANPTGRTAFTAADFTTFRDHDLAIQNTNSIPIHSFKARLQFPEVIVAYGLNVPTGANGSFCREDYGGWIVGSKSGKGEIEMNIPANRPFMNGVLEVDKLTPTFAATVLMRSAPAREEPPFPTSPGEIMVDFYFEGSFQYEWRGIFYSRRFAIPILYDRANRTVTTNAIYENAEDVGLRLVKNYRFF